MDSKLGLLLQLNGVFLITILSFLLRRSLKLTSLKYWATAWLSLSFSLICLRLAFDYSQLATVLLTYYYLGQYLFGFMLVAGCRSLDGSFQLRSRSELLIAPFVIVAILMPLVARDFSETFNIHSLILAGFFVAAFLAIRATSFRSFGWRVMTICLALLSLNSLTYFLVFTARIFLDYESDVQIVNLIVDLVLQTMLGIGMVIVLLEKVLFEYQSANDDLTEAHRKLEILVHTDPLTAAFNRHAFYGFVNRNGEEGNMSGCVGFFDIDNLKAINDCYGHSAGDAAIRIVVRALREIIRAEDLIFRWGGDEFFVIMVSMDAEMAETRMRRLDNLLRDVEIRGVPDRLTVGVSWGFRDFVSASDLEAAISVADAEMYRRKKDRKTAELGRMNLIPQISESGLQV